MDPRPELEVETPERVPVSLELAGLGARAFAWLADALCILFVWMGVLLVYSVWGELIVQFQALSFAGQLLGLLVVFVAGWGWDVAWETLVRNLLRAIEVPFAYAPGILCVAIGARRQRLGDLVAGTLVVRQTRFDL